MGQHCVRIYFPDGKVLCASYYTVSESLGTYPQPLDPPLQEDDRDGIGFFGLYAPNVRDGEAGFITHSGNFRGEPQPWRKNAPRSQPDELILVKIVEHPPDHIWHALYCPSRLELIGPTSGINNSMMNYYYELLSDHQGLLHLTRSDRFYESETFINSIPVPSVCGITLEHQDPQPFDDLYAEWHNGTICRDCLLHPDILEVEEGLRRSK
jgi:hypothetical protein